MLPLDLSAISVSFPGLAAPVLSIENLHVPAGTRLAVTGASGSGKSTLVNIITGLERVRGGCIKWGSTDIAGLSESRRDRWRAANVGLVMQDFHLFPGLSALDNILLPSRLAGAAGKETIARARLLLGLIGLKRPDQPVETMSRGEMQRVAVARALVRRPGIVVADEPTASLDAESGHAVGDLLIDLAEADKATLIVVSHDARLTSRLERCIRLDAGRILSDSNAGVSA